MRRTRIAIIHSKTSLSVIAGEACLAIRRGFYYGVPWRAATTAMLSENTQRAFNGRGVPRPYKALQKQGYRRDLTALTGRTRIAIIHSKTSLSVIAGEACLALTRLIIKMMFSMRYACLKCRCGAWGLFSNSRITFVFLRVRRGVFCLLLSWARSNFTQKVCCKKLLCTLFRIQTFSWCVLPLRGMNFVSWDKGQ